MSALRARMSRYVHSVLEDGKRGDFDYFFCKGCGICAAVCPFKAIEMVREEK